MLNLTEKQLKLISETVSQQAIKAFQENEQKRQEEKYDRRLRNIKLLLKNYRALVVHCEKIKDELIKFEDTSIQDLDIDTISLESIESIKQSKKKSLAMVYFVKAKMEAYKRSCSADEMKYYRVLEMKYLTPKRYTVHDIAEKEQVDTRTVNRYLNRAVSELPVIFFGVDAIRFEQ